MKGSLANKARVLSLKSKYPDMVFLDSGPIQDIRLYKEDFLFIGIGIVRAARDESTKTIE
jgi:hypothetical protein